MYCDSSSSDYGLTTSSSSSSSSGGRRSGGGAAKDISNYDKLFEDSKDALGAPPFIYVKGVPHFRSKTTGDLVNAGKPPNTPCRSCQKCHWYWRFWNFLEFFWNFFWNLVFGIFGISGRLPQQRRAQKMTRVTGRPALTLGAGRAAGQSEGRVSRPTGDRRRRATKPASGRDRRQSRR